MIRSAASDGATAHHQPCDVADHQDVEVFTKRAEEEPGPAYALVTSAGVVRDRPLVMMPVEDWTTVIETNLTGTFTFCRTVGFGMLKRRSGVIVTMSSFAGVHGHATQANYAASKAGVNGFSRTWPWSGRPGPEEASATPEPVSGPAGGAGTDGCLATVGGDRIRRR